MIPPVFTYCGTLGLCWSRSRKSRIESIERRSQKVIGGNYQVQTMESLIKGQSWQLVFDCLQDNVCTPFKGYFTKIEHNINTRNNGCSLNLPKAELEFGRSFAFQGAHAYNTLPRHLRNNSNSRFLFKSNLKEFFSIVFHNLQFFLVLEVHIFYRFWFFNLSFLSVILYIYYEISTGPFW